MSTRAAFGIAMILLGLVFAAIVVGMPREWRRPGQVFRETGLVKDDPDFAEADRVLSTGLMWVLLAGSAAIIAFGAWLIVSAWI